MPKSDVVIVGSGLAALVTASRLCTTNNVIIFTKSSKFNSNSMLAQGGIASVMENEDHWSSHYQDTIKAGCHHGIQSAIRELVQTGPNYIQQFINKGMKFDTDINGNLLLGHEGAHTYRRILHAGGDATGRALIKFLFQQLKNACKIVEHHMAVDIVIEDGVCIGITALDEHENVKSFYADHVILATGGCGAIYEYTSNDSSIVGDGYAIAYRAGAELVDMEFVQFHPTLLHDNGASPGLVSEAVRGEGGVLRREDGTKIMDGVHPLYDLAPRDIVSRAIYDEMQKGEKVYLDISMIPDFTSRFPTITNLCQKHNISLEEGRIPIVPGAHFMMGGVKVNHQCESSIPGLYAIGEVACTGVHGANRLASNSLLEGIVYGNKLADTILTKTKTVKTVHRKRINILETKKEKAENIGIEKRQIREWMMNNVGIVRNKQDLERVIRLFEPYVYKVTEPTLMCKEELTKLNMITTGWLIASSALRREESRGGHYREDIPETKQEWLQKHIVRSKYENVVLS